MQKMEATHTGGLTWKKYVDIDEALAIAREALGINYYIEPAAKGYIKLQKRQRRISPQGVHHQYL